MATKFKKLTKPTKPTKWVEPTPKEITQLEGFLGLLRLAVKELHEAGPRQCFPYAKRIRLMAKLADILSAKVYARGERRG